MQNNQIIFDLLIKRGVTAYKMSKDTGIPNSTITEWRKGRSKPAGENLNKLSEYFNISTDYLLGNEVKSKRISFIKTDDPHITDDITFDAFTYAMHDESKNLTEEQKNMLLDMAKIFNKKLKEEKEQKK